MGLTRSSSGLVERDDFGSDTTANYTFSQVGGDAASWSVTGGELVEATSDASSPTLDCQFGRTGQSGVWCVTAKIKANNHNWSQGQLRILDSLTPDASGYYPGYVLLLSDVDNNSSLYKRASNSWGHLATSGTYANAYGTAYLMRLYNDNTNIYCKIGASALTELEFQAADTTFNAGLIGMRVYTGGVAVDFLEARIAHTAVCSGMTDGHYLRVTDGTTAAEAAASSGTATVNAGQVLFPFTSVAIYTEAAGGGSKVAELTTGDHADMGGGDVFAYSAAAAGNPYNYYAQL